MDNQEEMLKDMMKLLNEVKEEFKSIPTKEQIAEMLIAVTEFNNNVTQNKIASVPESAKGATATTWEKIKFLAKCFMVAFFAFILIWALSPIVENAGNSLYFIGFCCVFNTIYSVSSYISEK